MSDEPTLVYEIETGVLHVEGETAVDVRSELVDTVIQQAVIAELERRGYVVLGPYT